MHLQEQAHGIAKPVCVCHAEHGSEQVVCHTKDYQVLWLCLPQVASSMHEFLELQWWCPSWCSDCQNTVLRNLVTSMYGELVPGTYGEIYLVSRTHYWFMTFNSLWVESLFLSLHLSLVDSIRYISRGASTLILEGTTWEWKDIGWQKVSQGIGRPPLWRLAPTLAGFEPETLGIPSAHLTSWPHWPFCWAWTRMLQAGEPHHHSFGRIASILWRSWCTQSSEARPYYHNIFLSSVDMLKQGKASKNRKWVQEQWEDSGYEKQSW